MSKGAALIAAVLAAAPVSAAPSADYDAAIAATKSVMMEDPAKALALAREAEANASAPLDTARAQWLQGEALSRLDQGNRALPILEKALATVVKVAPADRLHGDLLLSRGWVEETKSAIAPALTDFQHAFTLYRAAGEQRGQAKALQNIAGIYQDAGDTARSLRYYAQATEIYHGDPAFAIAAYNNVGETLRLLGRYRAAQAQYGRALAAAREAGSPLLQANILTNMATTRLLAGDVSEAEKLANRALALTRNREAADERPFALGVLAEVAMKRGQVERAQRLIGRTFAGVDLADSPLPYRDFHKAAAEIYARSDRPELALKHLRAWKRLDDNVRALAASTNAALMAARFDFSNQNLRIAQLQANRARLHEMVLRIVVGAVTLIAALMLAALLSLRRSRNQTRDANRQLTKALQAKSDFLAMTSHEIRTPLNGILGMTQVILADRHVDAALRTKIQTVHGAGETMRALVDDILDLSKMETGKLAMNRAPVPLRELLREASSLWRAKAESKGLTFAIDLDRCPILIEEDEDRLRQIVFNLLSNAVKFTETGGVTLRASGENERLAITVADTGIGIAPAQHELIFEKFQQADQSTSRRYGGTGLGLAICRNLAEAMDGTIAVESRSGEGATFTLALPLRALEAESGEAMGAEAAVAPVLLLEPNPLTQRVVARTLREAVGEVEAVGDADSLLAALSVRRTHVVVQAVAAGERLMEVVNAAAPARIVLLVASEDRIDESALNAMGAVLLRKPVAGDVLIAAVRGDAASEAA
jgi:signal transduction histidine kinase